MNKTDTNDIIPFHLQVGYISCFNSVTKSPPLLHERLLPHLHQLMAEKPIISAQYDDQEASESSFLYKNKDNTGQPAKNMHHDTYQGFSRSQTASQRRKMRRQQHK